MIIRTVCGYDFFEVSSAMQKAIRRADTGVAGFFALELWASGYRDYVWKRLFTISAEDCFGIITKEIEALWQGHELVKATTGYIEKHRKELQNKYKKFEAFNEKFEIDDNFLAEIRTLADKEKIKFDEKQYNQSLPLIKTQLKALIARDLWDMNEYFQVMNSTNQSVQQALKVLNEGIYSTIIQ